ncbi:unnamed protein product [Haemonchus placei]|uniref:Type VI secretion system protein ImpB n=1 Tax=Haemonchus placei TaxID=6290 RepID=A0A0N4VZK0_HAEPC|nr:unnamed protein product [Haemonchus placei]
MAQRTNLSVAGIFGPEHKLELTEMPFASHLDNRPAYIDMEELLALMDRTLALQSGSTVDQEGNKQPTIDFLTVCRDLPEIALSELTMMFKAVVTQIDVLGTGGMAAALL